MESYITLPKDIEIEILSRLPIKSLLCFKCVCQSWNNLIRSPAFARLHLDKSISLYNIDYCLVSHDPNYGDVKSQRMEMFASLLSSKSMEPLVAIEVPDIKDKKVGCIVGTYNGIICLYYDDTTFALLNPATKEFKVIPTPPETDAPDLGQECYELGTPFPSFGFDAKSNDYKLIKILWHSDEGAPNNISRHIFQIYSLNDGSWKEINNVGLLGFPQYSSCFEVYREGVYHLMTETYKGEVIIVWFDLHSETFGNMKGPYIKEEVDDESHTPEKIETPAILNGDLAFVSYEILEITSLINVWVMQEYLNEDSWVKRYTIGPIHAEPIYFWKGEKILLQTKKKSKYWDKKGQLISYDLNTQELEGYEIYEIPSCMYCFKFIPSLLKVDRV